jgi:isocitrate/isopropylmalate dehydrogenase
MADNPPDRPYAKPQDEQAIQRGQTRYAKAIPIVTVENMRHEVLPLAAANAARRLAQGRLNGSITKANAFKTYHQFLREEFVKAKQQYKNVQ